MENIYFWLCVPGIFAVFLNIARLLGKIFPEKFSWKWSLTYRCYQFQMEIGWKFIPRVNK